MRREKNPPKTTPPILRVKINSRVGHRRKSYERTKRQGGGRSGKLGGFSQNFWFFFASFPLLISTRSPTYRRIFSILFSLWGRTPRDLHKMFFFIKKNIFFSKSKKVDKVRIFGFCGKILNIFFVEFPEICKFRGKIALCSTYPRTENPKIRR